MKRGAKPVVGYPETFLFQQKQFWLNPLSSPFILKQKSGKNIPFPLRERGQLERYLYDAGSLGQGDSA